MYSLLKRETYWVSSVVDSGSNAASVRQNILPNLGGSSRASNNVWREGSNAFFNGGTQAVLDAVKGTAQVTAKVRVARGNLAGWASRSNSGQGNDNGSSELHVEREELKDLKMLRNGGTAGPAL